MKKYARFAERLRSEVLSRLVLEPRRASRTRRRVVQIVVGLAALVLVGLITWIAEADRSWAGVVAAVRSRPWIHAAAAVPDAGDYELWLSPVRGVSASRSDEEVIFDNHSEKVRYHFQPSTGTLAREPEPARASAEWRSLLGLFESVFRGDATLTDPFPGMKVLSQKRRSVEEAGRSRVEYQLDLRAGSIDRRLTIRVDPRTRLPESMTIAGLARGASPKDVPEEATFLFDYPDQGPADLHALGVPQATKIDDRVPGGELARLMDQVRSSRDRFPRNYLAIVTHALRSGTKPIPQFLWRKGEKWRREYRYPVARTPEERKALANLNPPPPGPEAVAWWLETTRTWRVSPIEICDGTAVYGDVSKSEKAEWKRVRNGTDLGAYRTLLPEFQGYPLLPEPSSSHLV